MKIKITLSILTLCFAISSFGSEIMTCSCERRAGCPERLTVKVNKKTKMGTIERFGKEVSVLPVSIGRRSIVSKDWVLNIWQKDAFASILKIADLHVDANSNEKLYLELNDYSAMGTLYCD